LAVFSIAKSKKSTSIYQTAVCLNLWEQMYQCLQETGNSHNEFGEVHICEFFLESSVYFGSSDFSGSAGLQNSHCFDVGVFAFGQLVLKVAQFASECARV
jgi:hypothetical protein